MKKEAFKRWKKLLAAALGALLVFGAVCGAAGALPEGVKEALPEAVREAVMPVTAQAAGGDPAIVTGTATVLGDPTDYNKTHINTQIVHYGGQKWYVVGYANSGVASLADTMTLISVGNLKSDVQFSTASLNEYSKSNLKDEVENIANAFSQGERAAVLKRTLEGGSDNQGSSNYDANKISGDPVSDALLWPLSVQEAGAMDDNLRRLDEGTNRYSATDFWWLRSPGSAGHDAAVVRGDGLVNDSGSDVTYKFGLRPAFYLNLNSVLFTSAAVGGKSSGTVGATALTEVSAMSSASSSNVNEWKLTLKDPNRSFSASTTSYDSSTEVLKFTYSGAKTGGNEYISVIVTDSAGKTIRHYGRVLASNSESGDATVNLSGKINAGDKVYAFNEQHYDDTRTDYSSGLVELTLSTPATAPSITTTTLPSGREGDSYTVTLSASGTAPINWSATGLPAGLSIGPSTGVISGTPTESGTFNVSVTATNTAGSDTKQLTLTIDPASGPAPAPTPPPSAPCATGHATYHWVTVRNADEHNDGEMVYLCSSCGHELYRALLSGYGVFQKNTAEKIKTAAQGATVSVSTRRWISFNREVMEALAARPDVTLTVSFLDGGYRGSRFAFTIPAGTDVKALWNEEGYAGFKFLGGRFGLKPGT